MLSCSVDSLDPSFHRYVERSSSRIGFKSLSCHASVDSSLVSSSHRYVDCSPSRNFVPSSRCCCCCFCKSAWIAPRPRLHSFVSSAHSFKTFCSDLVQQKRSILIAHRLAERKRKGVHIIGLGNDDRTTPQGPPPKVSVANEDLQHRAHVAVALERFCGSA